MNLQNKINNRSAKIGVIDGYVEWVLSCCNSDSDKTTWLATDNNEVVAFASCSLDDSNRECETALRGTVPKHLRKGVNTDCVRFTKTYFDKRGFRKMWMSTQAQNMATQKSFQRQGFKKLPNRMIHIISISCCDKFADCLVRLSLYYALEEELNYITYEIENTQ